MCFVFKFMSVLPRNVYLKKIKILYFKTKVFIELPDQERIFSVNLCSWVAIVWKLFKKVQVYVSTYTVKNKISTFYLNTNSWKGQKIAHKFTFLFMFPLQLSVSWCFITIFVQTNCSTCKSITTMLKLSTQQLIDTKFRWNIVNYF